VTAQTDLETLNREIADAERRGRDQDVAFLRSVLADGLRFRRANGSMVDRETFLDGVPDRDYANGHLTISDLAVVFNEDRLAVVTLLVDARGRNTATDTAIEGTFRNIRIFSQPPEGGWLCEMWFNAPVEAAGA
jgi:hypothetical protein